MKRLIGAAIWNASEALRIPLGPLAPRVFGWMVGAARHRKIND